MYSLLIQVSDDVYVSVKHFFFVVQVQILPKLKDFFFFYYLHTPFVVCKFVILNQNSLENECTNNNWI